MSARVRRVTVERYRETLAKAEPEITPNQRRFLRAHFDAPAYTATATELAAAVGYSVFQATNSIYGRLASKLLAIYGAPVSNDFLGVGFLFESDGFDAKRHIRLRLRPGLIAAIKQLGWFLSNTRDAGLPSSPSAEITSETVRSALREARIGQGAFRRNVIDYWRSCAVTGCGATSLLEAAHIKPWAQSTNQERLDPFNGLLLTPNLHAAFDGGLISFAGDGRLLISSRADPTLLTVFGIHPQLRIARLSDLHRPYLRFHREQVFAP